jgi:hypothetical protein
MRKSLFGIAGMAAIGILTVAVQPAMAAEKAENQLVGVKLWRGFRDVLAKHGQPTRIEIGAVTTPAAGGGGLGAGADAGGVGPMMGQAMGAPMMGSGAMMRGGGKMGAMMGGGGSGGIPGLTGMGPASGPGGMMGSGGMSQMMMNSMRGRRGGMAGQAMGGEDEGGGMLGAPGLAGGQGLGSGGMLGGGGLAGGGASGSEGEVTWVYERPGGLTYMFLFNKDGRVIQIQEYGYKGGGPTGSGITLGDAVSKLYSVYGWANNSTKAGNQLTLDYSQKHHVAFQLMDQGKGPKVIGITVAITERGQIPGQ